MRQPRLAIIQIIWHTKKCVSPNDLFYGYPIIVRSIPKRDVCVLPGAARKDLGTGIAWVDGFNLLNNILVLPDDHFHFGEWRQLLAGKMMISVVVKGIIDPASDDFYLGFDEHYAHADDQRNRQYCNDHVYFSLAVHFEVCSDAKMAASLRRSVILTSIESSTSRERVAWGTCSRMAA